MKNTRLKMLFFGMMLTTLLIVPGALAAEDATSGPLDPDHAAQMEINQQLEAIEADKEAVVDDLVSIFATDEVTAYQMRATLNSASASYILEIDQNADSIEAASEILAGDEGVLAVGDLNQDYVFTPVTPCRIIDTRFGGGGVFFPGQRREYFVYGSLAFQGGTTCNAPQGEPRGVHINITAVPQVGSGNFRVFPANVSPPNASFTNYRAGVQNVANAGTVKTFFSLGPREIEIQNSFGTSHLVVDVLGYYYPATGLSGADFASGNQTVSLTATDVTVRAVSISAPTSGRVIVNASGYFDFNSAGNDTGRCSITTGTVIDFSHLIISGDIGNTVDFVAFGATRGYNVGPGLRTFRLVCDEFAGIVQVEDTSLTATFVPESY